MFMKPSDVYPIQSLNLALKKCGDYVYAYYGKEEHPYSPFYVGKGRGQRVLSHWKNAASSTPTASLNAQEKEIRLILAQGCVPEVKLIAYNVEETTSEQIYSLVERVIQDAFGIQKVWEKNPGIGDRPVPMPVSTLVQVREDSAKTPVQSLDAIIGWRGGRNTVAREELVRLASASVLLVGLSKTYHPSFSDAQLAEMARMYWSLQRFTALGVLENSANAALLAWRTVEGRPVIVGAWRIVPGSLRQLEARGRFTMEVSRLDRDFKKNVIGLQLAGTGMNYMGPQIWTPAD
jgi:hypothetical protein